jgi:hypothetical protein
MEIRGPEVSLEDMWRRNWNIFFRSCCPYFERTLLTMISFLILIRETYISCVMINGVGGFPWKAYFTQADGKSTLRTVSDGDKDFY